MYNIEPLDDTEPWYTEKAQKQWEESVLKDLWKSFEEEIGNPNVDEMHDMAEALTDGMPEDGVKGTLDAYWREEYGFSRDFQKYVLEWIETVDTSVATVKRKDLVGNKTDLFMSFNYTDTLERVYGINGVLHIHGGVSSCTDTPPIMGHGNKKLIDMYREKLRWHKKNLWNGKRVFVMPWQIMNKLSIKIPGKSFLITRTFHITVRH